MEKGKTEVIECTEGTGSHQAAHSGGDCRQLEKGLTLGTE
jgi:hypothetical protein